MVLVLCDENRHESLSLPENGRMGDDTFVPRPPGFVGTRRDVLYLSSEVTEHRYPAE